MNLVSYSVWGNHPIYIEGAIQNSYQVADRYPGWYPLFFLDRYLYSSTEYKNQFHPSSIFVEGSEKHFGAIWRFLPLTWDEDTILLVRDADSRISDKEVQAVKEWLISPYQVHAMRDHPHHNHPIMAGMCGFKMKGSIDTSKIWEELVKTDTHAYLGEQNCLMDIYRRYLHEFCLEHDSNLSRYNSKPFPPYKKFNFGEFIGQRINPDGTPGVI